MFECYDNFELEYYGIAISLGDFVPKSYLEPQTAICEDFRVELHPELLEF